MAQRRADLVELRVLDGPNLYFPRPAVKLTMAVGGWLDVPEERLAAVLERVGATAAASFVFQRPRCDRVVAAVLARIC